MTPCARHTTRLVAASRAIGVALGGVSGSRLAARLRLSTSPTTLLSLVREAPVLTPYIPHLIHRWRERGADPDSGQLWHEIQTLVYAHSARTVSRFITPLRRAAEAGHAPEGQGSPYTCPQGPSARAVSFPMMSPAAKQCADAQTYLAQLCQGNACIVQAHALIQAFLATVPERRGNDLEVWRAEAIHSGITELASFARGLQDDLVAVTAGLMLEGIDGVTESQSHRPKLLKGRDFGHAGLHSSGNVSCTRPQSRDWLSIRDDDLNFFIFFYSGADS
jgi:hypothetical protein